MQTGKFPSKDLAAVLDELDYYAISISEKEENLFELAKSSYQVNHKSTPFFGMVEKLFSEHKEKMKKTILNTSSKGQPECNYEIKSESTIFNPNHFIECFSELIVNNFKWNPKFLKIEDKTTSIFCILITFHFSDK